MAKRTTSSKVGRFIRLAGMTATVAGRYTGNRLKSAFRDEDQRADAQKATFERMADDLVNTLGDLKGAVMKVGQIASQTQDLLPEEFSKALQKLQKEAPPVDFDVIRSQFKREFGAEPTELFKSFDRKPYAAASIGQVHRALTKSGAEVIVKIQYPGVADAVDSDLYHLRLALRLGGVLKITKERADALFAELKARLEEELDYEQEARYLRAFRKHHEEDEGILIPRVIERLSTRRILTLDCLEGDHLDSPELASYPQETRDILGERIFGLMAKQLFELNKIHGDPHPGNFAFRPDGSVIIYDFGCVKELRAEIVKEYTSAIRASMEEDYSRLDNAMLALGARVATQPSPGAEYYKVWRDIFFEPFSGIADYDYEQAQVHLNAAKQMPLFFKHMKKFQPPVDSLYIDRMISGQYWIMKSLGVKKDFRKHLLAYL